MDKNEIRTNLSEIEEWMLSRPDPSNFKTDDDFMNYTVDIMNFTLYLLKVGCALIPREQSSFNGYTKRRAIIIGHLVRITKLYEGLLIHISKRQLELAAIFNRLIFESVIRTRYLMKARNKSFQNFILISYRPEKEILSDLNSKAATRPLIPIEKRMRRKIKARLKKDKIPIKTLMSHKTWNLDGKDFRNLLQEVTGNNVYAYGFGSASHPVHGDWYEISLYHIKREGRYYYPDLRYHDPDPRICCPLTIICLDLLEMYLKWNRLDSDMYVSTIVSQLLTITQQLDSVHENTMGE